MKRHWIEYTPEWTPSHLSFWVHHQPDGRRWTPDEPLEPPLPGPVPGKGFARYLVEHRGLVLEFRSLAELDRCIEVLGKKLLPTTNELKARRRTTVGPNGHWLSRLPASHLSWRIREKLVGQLQTARAAFATHA